VTVTEENGSGVRRFDRNGIAWSNCNLKQLNSAGIPNGTIVGPSI
jgi:hypothetical protein